MGPDWYSIGAEAAVATEPLLASKPDANLTGEALRGLGARPGGTETVLVAEDEPGVRSPVGRILAAHGYRVLEAEDGAAALRIAARHEGAIDLLLTDVVMPGMNGGELAQRMRRLRSGIRVVFMSGYSSEAVATHGVLSPGSAFLQKPFSVEELVERLRDALDREPG